MHGFYYSFSWVDIIERHKEKLAADLPLKENKHMQ